MLTTALFNEISDAITAIMLQTVPAGAYANVQSSGGNVGGSSGYGDSLYDKGQAGDYGQLKASRDLEDLILGHVGVWPTIAADYDTVNYLSVEVHKLQTILPLQNRLKTDFQQLIQQLTQLCAASGITGVTDIDTWCTYYNTGGGGVFAALMKPDFTTLYKAVYGKFPTAHNVAAPVIANIGALTYPSTYSTLKSLTTVNGLTIFAGAAVSQLTANVVLAASHGLATGNYVVVIKGNGQTANGTAFASGDAGHFWKSAAIAVVNGSSFSNAALTFAANTAGDVLQQLAAPPGPAVTIGIYPSPYTDGVTVVTAPSGVSSVTINVGTIR